MKFKIEQTSEKINSIGGTALIGAQLDQIGFNQLVNEVSFSKGIPVYSNSDILRSYMGLLCQGRSSFDDLNLYNENEYYCNSLGINKLPSAERLRQRMDISAEFLFESIKAANLKLLQGRSFGELTTSMDQYIPWDCDVSPMDNSRTSKEDVSFTYKGFDGYAPMFGYLGTEGYMLDCELRPGSQHCQKGTVEFLERGLKMLEKLVTNYKILLRLDSGNDSTDNLALLLASECMFIIKRNLRREPKEQWLEIAMSIGKKETPRPGKNVYKGVYYSKQPAGKEPCDTVPVAFEVTVRDINSKGETLLFPELVVNTYWTNLPEGADEIINLYHDHATSEQFHSEVKSDMNIERLPSGKFKTNALVLQLTMLMYNCLRTIGQEMLKRKDLSQVKLGNIKRRRIKSVIRDLILIACKYVKRSNRNFIKFGKNCPWFAMYKSLYEELSA